MLGAEMIDAQAARAFARGVARLSQEREAGRADTHILGHGPTLETTWTGRSIGARGRAPLTLSESCADAHPTVGIVDTDGSHITATRPNACIIPTREPIGTRSLFACHDAFADAG